MDSTEWIARCATRLQHQWPRVPREQLDELARDLHREIERQAREPETAAAQWLRRGIPTA